MAPSGAPSRPVQLRAAVCVVGLLACLSGAFSVQTRENTAVVIPDPSCKFGQVFHLSDYSVTATPANGLVSTHTISILQAQFQSGFDLLLPLCHHPLDNNVHDNRSRLIVRSTNPPLWWMSVNEKSHITVTRSGVNSFLPTESCFERTQWLHLSVAWGDASANNIVSFSLDGSLLYRALLPHSTDAFQIYFNPSFVSDSAFILSHGFGDVEIQTITSSLSLWNLELWRDDSVLCLCSSDDDLEDCLNTVWVSHHRELWSVGESLHAHHVVRRGLSAGSSILTSDTQSSSASVQMTSSSSFNIDMTPSSSASLQSATSSSASVHSATSSSASVQSTPSSSASVQSTPSSSASVHSATSSSASVQSTPSSSASVQTIPSSSASLQLTPSSSASVQMTLSSSASLQSATSSSTSVQMTSSSSLNIDMTPSSSASVQMTLSSSASLQSATSSSTSVQMTSSSSLNIDMTPSSSASLQSATSSSASLQSATSSSASVQMTLSSSASLQLTPSSSASVQMTPSSSASLQSATSSSASVQMTLSSSASLQSATSSSASVQMTSSSSLNIDMTPSSSASLQSATSSSTSVQMTSSSSAGVQTTPSSSASLQSATSSSDSAQSTPSSSDSVQMTPSSSLNVDMTPSSSASLQSATSSSTSVQMTSSSSLNIDMTPSSSASLQSATSSSASVQMTLSSSASLQSATSSSTSVQMTSSSSLNIDMTPSSSASLQSATSSSTSVQMTSSSSLNIDMTPSSSDSAQSTPSSSLNVDVTPSSSDSVQATPSSSLNIDMTPSSSDSVQSTPSSSFNIDMTPSSSDSVQATPSSSLNIDMTPSSSDSVQATPSSSLNIDMTPSSSDSVQSTPSSSFNVDMTPSSSDSVQATPSSSLNIDMTPSSSDSVQSTPSSSLNIDMTPSSSDSVQSTPSSSFNVDMTPSSSDSVQATPSSSLNIDMTPSSSDSVQSTPSSSLNIDMTPSSSDSVQSTPSSSFNVDMTPSSSDSVQATPSSSLNIDMTPSSSDSVQATPSSSLNIDMTPSSSDSVQSTPSSSLNVEMTPSSSDNVEMTSSTSVSLQTTPSTSVSVQLTPSSSDSVQATPSSSLNIDMTPSSSDSVQATPSSSLNIDMTPSSSDSVQATPSSSLNIDMTPSSSDSVQSTPSSSFNVDMTPSSSDSVQLTPSSSLNVEMTPSSSDNVEMTSSTSVSLQTTPSTSVNVQLTPSSSDNVEMTPSSSDNVEMISPSSDSIGLSPSVSHEIVQFSSDSIQMTLPSSVSIEVAPSSTVSVEVTPSASVSPHLTPSGTEVSSTTSRSDVLDSPSSSLSTEGTPTPTSVLVTSSLGPSSEVSVEVTPTLALTLTSVLQGTTPTLTSSEISSLQLTRSATPLRISSVPLVQTFSVSSQIDSTFVEPTLSLSAVDISPSSIFLSVTPSFSQASSLPIEPTTSRNSFEVPSFLIETTFSLSISQAVATATEPTVSARFSGVSLSVEPTFAPSFSGISMSVELSSSSSEVSSSIEPTFPVTSSVVSFFVEPTISPTTLTISSSVEPPSSPSSTEVMSLVEPPISPSSSEITSFVEPTFSTSSSEVSSFEPTFLPSSSEVLSLVEPPLSSSSSEITSIVEPTFSLSSSELSSLQPPVSPSSSEITSFVEPTFSLSFSEISSLVEPPVSPSSSEITSFVEPTFSQSSSEVSSLVEPPVSPSSSEITSFIEPMFSPSSSGVSSFVEPTFSPSSSEVSSLFEPTFSPSSSEVSSLLEPTFSPSSSVVSSLLEPSFSPSSSEITSFVEPTFSLSSSEVSSLLEPSFSPSTSEITSVVEPTFSPSSSEITSFVEPTFSPSSSEITSFVEPTFSPSSSEITLFVEPTFSPSSSEITSFVEPTFSPSSSENSSLVEPTFSPSSSEVSSLVEPTFSPSSSEVSSLVEPTFSPSSSEITSFVEPTFSPSSSKISSLVEPTFSSSSSEITSFVEPTFSPSSSEISSLVEPTFSPSSSEVSSLVEPTFSPSSSEITSFVEPTFSPSSSEITSFVEPTFSLSSSEVSSLVEPTFSPSSSEISSLVEPTFSPSSSEVSSLVEPTFSPSSSEISSLVEPTFSPSSSEVSSLVEPTFSPSSSEITSFVEPTFSPSSSEITSFVEPTFSLSSFEVSSLVEPTFSPSSSEITSFVEPTFSPSSSEITSFVEPTFSPSSSEITSFVEPTFSPSSSEISPFVEPTFSLSSSEVSSLVEPTFSPITSEITSFVEPTFSPSSSEITSFVEPTFSLSSSEISSLVEPPVSSSSSEITSFVEPTFSLSSSEITSFVEPTFSLSSSEITSLVEPTVASASISLFVGPTSTSLVVLTSIQSSIVSTSFIVPTPSPSPSCALQEVFCDCLMMCIDPTTQECPDGTTAPVEALAKGKGVLLLGKPTKSDEDEYRYRINFTSFTFNPESLQVSVGETQESVQLFAVNVPHIARLRIIVSSQLVWQGRPWAHAAVQLLGSHGQPVVALERLKVVIYINSNMISSCKVKEHESYCHELIHFAGSRFDGLPVSLTAKADWNQSLSDSTNITLKPEAPVYNGSVSLSFPINHVFPNEMGQLAIRTNYSQPVAGFDATCESTVRLAVVSDGSFSVLSAQRSDGRIVDANGLQAIRSSNRSSNFEVLFLLNVSINESSNISLNIMCTLRSIVLDNLEKVVTNATFLTLSANISVVQNEVAGILAYASQYTLLNTAALNGMKVTLQLWTFVLHTDGTMDSSGVTCTSSNMSVLKVYPNCSHVYLNGTETPGQANVSFFANEINHFQLRFDVWGPVGNIMLEVEDKILNRLENCDTEEFQETRVRATANISNTPTCSMGNCITADVSHLLTLSTSDNYIAKVDSERTGIVKGVSKGVATISVSNSILPVQNVEVTVDQQSVVATCLHVFVVSDLAITLNNQSELVAGGDIAADLLLRQELLYADSRAEVIAVVVLNDSFSLVVNVDSRWNMSVLPSRLYNRTGAYIVPLERGQSTVVVDAFCGNQSEVIQGSTSLNITLNETHGLSIMQVGGNRSYIVNASDPSAAMFGSLLLKVFVHHVGHTADVTELAHYQVENNSALTLEFVNGTCRVTANGPRLGVYEVKVNHNGYEERLSVSVVRTENVSVVFRPYPIYSGSQEVAITTLHAVSGVYPPLMLEASAVLSNNSVSTTLNSSAFSVVNDSGDVSVNTTESGINVLIVDSSTSSNVVVTVHFGSASGTATLHLNDTPPTVMKVDNATVRDIDGEFHIDCELEFASGVRVFSLYDYNTQEPQYVQLVRFEVQPEGKGVIDINSSSGRIQVERNFYKRVTISVMSAKNMSLFDETSFEANLPPLEEQLDLGNTNGLPLQPIEKGTSFEVPIVLNAGKERVGVMEAEVSYNASLLEFLGMERGQSWSLGSLYYDDDNDKNVVKFGGILTSGASHTVEVAMMRFCAHEAGLAEFSGTILYTARAEFSNNSTITTNVMSPAANVAVLVNSQSRRRREIASVKHRIRRQSSSSRVLGDVTGDGVVDLRDTVVLQFYTVGVASNFMSDVGQEIMSSSSFESVAATIIATDLDGDGVVTVADVVSSEKLSEGLINIIQNISVSPSDGEPCSSVHISGCVRSSSGSPAPTSSAVVFVHISNSNASFQKLFNTTDWHGGEVRYRHSISDDLLAGGIIEAKLDMTSCFNVSAMTIWEELVVDVVIIHGINGTSLEVLEGGGTKDIPAFSTGVQFMTEGSQQLEFDNGLAPLHRITCPLLPSSSVSSSIAVSMTTSLSDAFSRPFSSEAPSPSQVPSSIPSSTITPSSSVASEVPSAPLMQSPTPSSTITPSSSVASEVPSAPLMQSPTPSPIIIPSSSVVSEVPSTPLVLSSTTSTTSSMPLELPRSSTTSTSTTPTSTPTTSAPSDKNDSSTTVVIAGVVIGVPLAVAIAAVTTIVIVFYCYRRMNKVKYDVVRVALSSNNHMSNGKDCWSRMEEHIEMSPIDIVPMAPQSHEETFHDNTQSDIGYMNHGYGSMDRSGTVPRRPTNGHVKHLDAPISSDVTPSFQSSTPARPHHMHNHHNHHSGGFEDDTDYELTFEEPGFPPYLSLGLTPASQLSPEHETGFFPGLPPPITPAISDNSYNFPVDSHMFVKINPMVAHDVTSTSSHVRRVGRSGPRDLKETLSLSRSKLAPVPEHGDSTSPDIMGRRSSKASGSSFKWSPDEPTRRSSLSNTFSPPSTASEELNIFPSASLSLGNQGSQTSQGSRSRKGIGNLSRMTSVTESLATPSYLSSATEDRRSNQRASNGSISNRRASSDSNSFLYPTMSGVWDGEVPQRESAVSPSEADPWRYRREMQLREKETQKEIMRQQILEEERSKRREQQRRAYGLASDVLRQTSGNVYRQAARYDATVEVMREDPRLRWEMCDLGSRGQNPLQLSSLHSTRGSSPSHKGPSPPVMNGRSTASPLRSPVTSETTSDEFSTFDQITSL